MIILIQILLILNILFFIWQIYLVKYYKNIENENFYPYISVIIPAYNEGIFVKNTINSVLNANYPKDKLEIIVINDGSTDNTHEIIKETIKNTNVKYINLLKNKGKRNAIYCAAMQSTGEFLITIDSDSIIDKNTLINLIVPFKDNTVGAVAGNILVKNTNKILPNMLYSAFIFGFQFLRPAQSMLGCVLCTPGALSAYRKSVILPELNTWCKAIFFGHRSNIGEDRALTTIILKKNYKVIYQNNTCCYTNVPETYSQLAKMFMRWIRGDIRESFCLFWFIKNIFKYKWNFNIYGIICQLFMQFIWLISPFLLIYYFYLCYLNFSYIIIFIYSSIIMTIFWSILPGYICYKTNGIKYTLYSYLYGLFNILTLFWIIPYCWFTIGKSNWLTRNKK